MNAPTQQSTAGSGGPQERHPDAGPPCVDSARALLLPYAMATCREEDALEFEVHLLMCERCFEDLKVLDRAGALIREFREQTQNTPRARRGPGPHA